MITWCCKPDCPGRHPACHGTCEKYKAWEAAVKAEKPTQRTWYPGTE